MNDMMSGGMMMGMGASGPLMMLVLMAVTIVIPFWFIFSKAGYSKWLSLLMVIPLVNIALLYFLAFSTWPRGGARNSASGL